MKPPKPKKPYRKTFFKFEWNGWDWTLVTLPPRWLINDDTPHKFQGWFFPSKKGRKK